MLLRNNYLIKHKEMNCMPQKNSYALSTQAILKDRQTFSSLSNLNKVAHSSRPPKKEKIVDNHKTELRDSKNSHSTNQSYNAHNDTFGPIQDINFHDFTFNHIQHDLEDGKQKKFTNQSPFSVVIFGILFNHLHLHGLQVELREVTQLSSLLVKNLKAAFIQLEAQVNQNQPEINFSALEISQLVSGIYGKRTNQKQRLTDIISKINKNGAERIIKEVVNAQKNISQRMCSELQAQNTEKSSNWHLLHTFACLLGIKIKIYEGERKRKVGPQFSLITLSLRRNQRQNTYSLKEIRCNPGNNA